MGPLVAISHRQEISRRLRLLQLSPLIMNRTDKEEEEWREALEDGEEEEGLWVLVVLQGQQPLLLVCMRLHRFELDHEPPQRTVVISFF